MNQDRRTRLAAAIQELTTIRDEEQDAYDNLPESIQGGAKGDKMQETIDALENSVSELEGIDA